MQKPSNITIILAAGKSTRIRELCFDRPKTLLTVNGQSLLSRLCIMFDKISSDILIVAGDNYQMVHEHISELNLSIKVIRKENTINSGNAASLKAGLAEISGEYNSVTILESDIILSEDAFKTYIDVDSINKFMVVRKELTFHDDKLYFSKEANDYIISKEALPRLQLLGKFIGVSTIPFHTALELKKQISDNSPQPYIQHLGPFLDCKSSPIPVSSEDAEEIDTVEDYKRVLYNYKLGKKLECPCRQVINFYKPIQRFVGVYDVIGAQLAQRVGFDGLWLGSFQIAISSGEKDDGSYSLKNSLDLAASIRKKGISLPIIIDIANGFKTPQDAETYIEKLLEYNVSAICIDDNIEDRVCSLYGSLDRKVLPVGDFSRKLKELTALSGTKVQVIARTETLNIGLPKPAVMERLDEICKTGVSAVLPHYVGSDYEYLSGFLSDYHFNKPFILIPTGLMDLPISQFKALQCAIVIYANIDLRLRFSYLLDTYSNLILGTRLEKETLDYLANPVYMKEMLE